MKYLENQTVALVKEAKELMNFCVKQIDVDDIKNIDAASLEGIQKVIKFVDHACDLSISQAEKIDEMNEKLDKILWALNWKEKNEDKGS